MEMEATFESAEVRKFLLAVTKNHEAITSKKQRYTSLLSVLVFQDIMDHFKNEQGPKGAWVAWSKIYILHLQRKGREGNKKLQYSGRMRNTFTPTKYRPTPNGILWFNNAQTKSGFPYAQAHDEGAPSLPARPFMFLSDKALDRISEQTLQFLMDEG